MPAANPQVPDQRWEGPQDAHPSSFDPRQRATPEQATQLRVRDALLIALTAVGGYIDAVSYGALGHVFVANVTGSTVLLGFNVAQGHALFALRAYAALAGFLLGVTLGALIDSQRVNDHIWPRSVTMALLVEVATFTVFAAIGLAYGSGRQHGPVYILLALAGLAMGIQSVAIRSLGVVDVTTTYITSTWVGLMAGVARIFKLRVEHRNHAHPQANLNLRPQARDARLVLVYIVSAGACGLLINLGVRWVFAPLPFIMAAIVAVALRTFRRPLPKPREGA